MKTNNVLFIFSFLRSAVDGVLQTRYCCVFVEVESSVNNISEHDEGELGSVISDVVHPYKVFQKVQCLLETRVANAPRPIYHQQNVRFCAGFTFWKQGVCICITPCPGSSRRRSQVRSRSQGGQCHLKVLNPKSMYTKYEHCNLYRSKVTDTISLWTDVQTDKRTSNKFRSLYSGIGAKDLVSVIGTIITRSVTSKP